MNINYNIIQIYNNKIVKFFSKDFTNIILKIGYYVRKNKEYNWVFKITILGLKNNILFVVFWNFYLIIGISKT